MMAATYVPIQSVTLASSAASVTFSGIPQTYTDLVVRVSVRSDRANSDDTIEIVFNSNGGSVYSETQMYGRGTTASSQRQSYTSDQLNYINGANSTANTFASLDYYIPSYASNQYKPFAKSTAKEDNSASGNFLVGGASLFRSTTAISTMTLTSYNLANFVAGSTFHLYGIAKN